MIYLTSDTHYYHANVLKFKDSQGHLVRNFRNVNEMNECMFDGWNETVRENDTVYHLGDLAMGPYKNSDFADKFRSLPGKKYLIVGNHDDIKWCVKSRLFKNIVLWKKFYDKNFILTHAPIDLHNLKYYTEENSLINIHGHIHNLRSPTINHRCVCVEWTDYKPISIDKVLDLNNFSEIS